MNPNEKRKNQSPLRVIVNAWGCLLGMVMLLLGGAVGLFGAVFFAPQLLGFNLTATAIAQDITAAAERAIVLEATSVDLESRARDAEVAATNFALEIQATQAIIYNEIELLGQTATQSSQNIIATVTAIAAENSQQQTQIAINYQATQAQLQSNATQAEIDFQHTRAALGIPVTESAPNLSANPASYNFSDELDLAIWQVSDEAAWTNRASGLEATIANAAIIETEARLLPAGNYRLEIVLQPAATLDGEYWFFVVGAEEGIAVYLHAQTLSINEVAFYSFDAANLELGALSLDNVALLSRAAANQSLSSQASVELVVQGDSMRVLVDGEVLHSTDNLPLSHGRVGVQLPIGAVLQSLELGN